MSSERELADLRGRIAALTREIIDTMAERNALAKEVGALKEKEALPVEDPRVEDALVALVVGECAEKGVDARAGLKVLSAVLAEAKRVQGGRAESALVTPQAMSAKAREVEARGTRLIRLDVGEPDFHPPRGVLDATSQALYGFKTHYTGARGVPQVLSAVREYLERKNGFKAKETEVMVTPGGRFAVYAALSVTVGEGESAIVVEPNWPAYGEALRYLGARPVPVHTTLEEGWEPTVESIRDAIRPNTRAIILSYPANPTGKMISPEKFGEIVKVANDNSLTVISDEIYNDYAYKPCPSVLGAGARSFILTASFSKTWAMTGFRVGYSVSSEDVISKMAKLQSLVVSSVPEFIQYGAVKALQSDAEAEQNSAAMKERIEAACHELERLDSLEVVRPDGAMYVFPQARKKGFDSTAFAMRLLDERGVTISPGTGFGDYPRCFRVSLGQSKETVVEGIRRIGESLA